MNIKNYELEYAAINSIDITFSYFRRLKFNLNKKKALEILKSLNLDNVFENRLNYDLFLDNASLSLKESCGNSYGIAIFLVNLYIKHLAFYLSDSEKKNIYAPFSRAELEEIKTSQKSISGISSFAKYKEVIDKLIYKIENNQFDYGFLNNAESIYEWEIRWWNHYWKKHKLLNNKR